jgi:transposase
MKIQYYIGVDMAKQTFYACFDEQSKPALFSNTHSGIAHFFKQCHTYFNDSIPQHIAIGVESTGIYHLLLCMQAKVAGYVIKLINPIITHKYTQLQLRSPKTDPLDARLIRLCLVNGEGYYFQDTPAILLLKQLIREREFLAQLKRTIAIRHSVVIFKEQAIGSSLYSAQTALLPIIISELKQLQKKLTQYQPHEQRLLQTIPGVGPLTAATFISEIQDITRFTYSAQLIAFIGIDPKVHQSGISIDKYRHISKRGNALLRTRLYNATSVAVLKPNQFQCFFQKKISAGKAYRVALVATMHKLARVIYAVWKHNSAYQEPT